MITKENLAKNKNYHGFVNTLPEDDKRIPTYLQQHEEQGFDSTEIWNLYGTITKFVLPRLKEFKEMTECVYPMGMKKNQWSKIVDKMIIAFELIDKDESGLLSDEDFKKVKQGLNLFAKHFMSLWY